MLPISWLSLTLQIEGPPATFAASREFWAAVTGTEPTGHDGHVTLEPATGSAYLALGSRPDGEKRPAEPLLGAGPVPPETDGSCGLTLQLPAGGSLTGARESAVTLGAHSISAEPSVVQLKSPGGYGFSVTVAPEETLAVPPPVTIGDGGLSRADQVTLDVPPELFGREYEFWSALTGWKAGGDGEFRWLDPPSEVPVRILLQRRDHAEPGETVTAHLDFATQDRWCLAAVHVGLGATLAGEWDQWISLRDPAGRIYCLTRRAPS